MANAAVEIGSAFGYLVSLAAVEVGSDLGFGGGVGER